MLISHTHKFVFLHIPRTAGVSVAKCLAEFSDIIIDNPTYRHQPLSNLKNFEIDLSKYFKFTFVRNPWDRLVSDYHYNKQTPLKIIKSFPNWLNKKLAIDKLKFKDYVKNIKDFPNQTSFINDDNINLDFIGKFESLQNDFNIILDQIGIKKDLPHTNKSQHNHYKSYYDEKSMEIAYSYFKEDVELLGYQF